MTCKLGTRHSLFGQRHPLFLRDALDACLGSERSATVQTDGEMLLDRNQQRTPAMKTIASAIAATMLLIGPMSAPTPAFAGFAAGNLGEAVPRAENSAIQDVRNHRRGVRHERRMRQE